MGLGLCRKSSVMMLLKIYFRLALALLVLCRIGLVSILLGFSDSTAFFLGFLNS